MELIDRIAAERLRVADLLDDLTDAEWATPSLCAGWKVRDVAAHLTAGWNASLPRFALGIVRHRGFDGANAAFACDLARRPTAEIVADLRANATDRFSPPVVGLVGQLADVITHGQDIARPLGRVLEVTPDQVRPALDMAVRRVARVVSPVKHRDGVRFTTTDQVWSWGSGPIAEGDSVSVLITLLGRRAGTDTLTGPGVSMVRERLAI